MTNDSIITTSGKNITLHRTYTETADLSSVLYTAPSQVKVGINNGTPAVADTDLDEPIPIAAGVVNDDGDNTLTGVSGGEDSTDNPTTYKEGANANDNIAQNLITNGSSDSKVWVISDLSALGIIIDPTKAIGLNLYIKDSTTMDFLLNAGGAVLIKFGINTSNYYSLSYTEAEIAEGWNWLSSNTTAVEDLTETGTVTGDIDYFEIVITTNHAADSWGSGDVIYDLLRTWSYSDTVVDLSATYPQFDYTTNEVTLRAYLNTLQAAGFLLNGLAVVNQDTTPLMHGEDTMTADSKSITDEIIYLIVDTVE